MRWVWPGIIARAKVTGLVGHPGLGKSQVATDLAATVSTGRPWPGGVANDCAGEVIVLSAEDDAADTGVPRLIAAGAVAPESISLWPSKTAAANDDST